MKRTIIIILFLILLLIFGCTVPQMSAPPTSNPEFDYFPIEPITSCSSADSCPESCTGGTSECLSNVCMCKVPFKYTPTHPNLSSTCIEVEKIVQNMDFGAYPTEYSNNSVKQMIETKSNKTITLMRLLSDENISIVLAPTESGETCVATIDEFCFCD